MSQTSVTNVQDPMRIIAVNSELLTSFDAIDVILLDDRSCDRGVGLAMLLFKG